MVQWKELSMNARVALCLMYAEKMIPKIEALINYHTKLEQYAQGKQQLDDILNLAWNHLQDEDKVDWSEMYYLCNEGVGWTDDVKYNNSGYFDFIWMLDDSNDKEARILSVMMINCFYYAMYVFAKRQNDNIPSDMEGFDCEDIEENAFSSIDRAVNLFINSDEINALEARIFKLFPFNKETPFGDYISRETVGVL